MTNMKVGALAKRTGLTVRTLHHYDEIGLLRPGRRTTAGHRLYGDDEVRRLQQIVSLRYLGLPLEEIRDCLARPAYTLDHVLGLQLERIEKQIGRQEKLRDLVLHLRARLHSAEGASVDEVTRTIEATMEYEKHYTPEQLEQLKERREDVGEERIELVQQEWTDLFEAYGKAMKDGLDPASAEVAALAEKAASLMDEFTGGDPEIAASLGNLYRSEGGENIVASHGMQTPPGLWEYMSRASAALKEAL